MSATSKQNAERIRAIADEITDLIYEAGDIIRSEDTQMYAQFKAYTMPHIVMNAKKEHDWLGREQFPLESFTDEIDEAHADEDEEDDEDDDGE